MIQLSSLKLLDNGLTQAVFVDGSVRLYHELIAVDFDGESNASYTNVQLGIALNDITVVATVDEATQATILEQLNATAAEGVLYVNSTDAALAGLDNSATSTIYVGDTDDLASLGSFAGIAETTGDFAAATQGDNAFVLAGSDFSADSLVDTIAHEAGHLMGSIEHDFDNNGLSLDDFGTGTRIVINSGESRPINNTFISDLSFSGSTYGAAVYNEGTATISGSTFSGNKATTGGAIYANTASTVSITNSTFSGNTATNSSDNQDYGGAIYANTASIIGITNSTFNGNTAGYGGAISANTASIVDISGSTFSGNTAIDGGAVTNSGTATISASTFSGNMADHAAVCNHGIATIEDSIFSGNTGITGGAVINTCTATISGSTFSGNTAGYGGAVVNYLYSATISGSTFSGNTASKGGAVYNYIMGTFTALTSTFSGNTASKGGAVNNNFYCIFTASTSTFSDNTAIDGGAVTNSGTATIEDSTFSTNISSGTESSNGGGAVYNTGTATISGSTFSGNTATSTGGAVYNSIDTATISDSTFTGNKADDGGAVYNYEGTFTASTSIFSDNTATDGGAVYNAGIATINYSTFSGNSASDFGGAVFNCGTATISGSTFSGNKARNYGGAIYNSGTATENVIISGSTFSRNTANNGGAVYNYEGTFTASSSIFSGNTATTYGGAVYNTSGIATISGSTFSGNTSNNKGGAIYNNNKITISDCTFSGNSATDNGGAIYNTNLGNLTLSGTIALQTTSDTIYNAGTMTWDLTGGTATITNYQYVTNTGTLCIKVDNSMESLYSIGETVSTSSSFFLNNTNFALIGIGGSTITLDNYATVTQEGAKPEWKITTSEYVSGTYGGYTYTLTHHMPGYGNNLVLTTTANDVQAYVNSAWTETSCDGHTWSKDAFCSFSTAKVVCPMSTNTMIHGVTEAGSTQSGVVVLEGYITSLEGAGTYTGVVMGGTRSLSGSAAVTQNTNLTISAGVYKQNVVGGGYAGNSSGASLTQTGTDTLIITGGTFEHAVAGGMYAYNNTASTNACVRLNAGSAATTAVDFEISGGTFSGRIYGGNYAYSDDATADNSVIDGSVNLVFDSSTNTIQINAGIDGGSRGTSNTDTKMITGDVTVTFTGSGSNLNFGSDGASVYGGCNMDGFKKTDEGETELVTGVDGERTLLFDAFTGNFAADIRLFETLSLKGGSTVNLTFGDMDLTNVEIWDFQDTSSKLTGMGTFDFKDDTLSLTDTTSRILFEGTDSTCDNWFSKITVGSTNYTLGTSSSTGATYSSLGYSNLTLTLSENGSGNYKITIA